MKKKKKELFDNSFHIHFKFGPLKFSYRHCFVDLFYNKMGYSNKIISRIETANDLDHRSQIESIKEE